MHCTSTSENQQPAPNDIDPAYLAQRDADRVADGILFRIEPETGDIITPLLDPDGQAAYRATYVSTVAQLTAEDCGFRMPDKSITAASSPVEILTEVALQEVADITDRMVSHTWCDNELVWHLAQWQADVARWSTDPARQRNEPPLPDVINRTSVSDSFDGVPMDPWLLDVPGFVNELQYYTLSQSPYPSRALAFCGALAAQSLLCGRKVRDESDCRTNLMLLALADSATGKDAPRKTNMKLAKEVGLIESIGDNFASSEGLEDHLLTNPSLLMQNDEIDVLLTSFSDKSEKHAAKIQRSLLKLYADSKGTVARRRKAGDKETQLIEQPHLTVFGTAIPQIFYASLTPVMLANGLFSRMLIVEAGKRSQYQETVMLPLPTDVVEIAKYWVALDCGPGNLSAVNPEPKTILADAAGKRLLREVIRDFDAHYEKARVAADLAGKALWGRGVESVHKLALIYACSQSHENPVVTAAAVEWAQAFVKHCIESMLERAGGAVAENAFDATQLRLLRILKEAGGALKQSTWLKRSKLSSRDFANVLCTLVESELLACSEIKTKGRTCRMFRLLDNQD